MHYDFERKCMQMTISLGQALLIGIWAGFCLAGQMWGIYTNRSLVLALGVGIILGDIPTALAMGAVGEIAFLGFGVSIAGTAPPNQIGPGIIGTLMAITLKGSGMTPESALALSFPFAVAVQFLVTLSYTLPSPVSSIATKLVQKEKFFQFKLVSHITIYLLFIVGFAVGFSSSISMHTVQQLVNAIPAPLIKGLTVAGSMLPAAGFAIILNILSKGQVKYLPFVFLGYVCISYLKLPVMGVTFVAIVFALYDYFSREMKKNSSENAKKEVTQ
ncbi:PTS sugar transporter subunit IIC [Clostridium botulinum]|nr:PTS sugar transporter subunit IIC [Clostridium botulinum D/C]QPW59003.1 PTS sugar transporter subunit IIC [Clostridium botulinum]MCD3239441.1 PTS sugar transporter subunit IIC [Clostridium botulinum D/C]MCD3267077.1 PTS sugar transporter subunit IIC [Clostridium botulinum D/C]MCD3298390.1 PTS sugar transporter subunit IIC [Clostridium botulinum D/C]